MWRNELAIKRRTWRCFCLDKKCIWVIRVKSYKCLTDIRAVNKAQFIANFEVNFESKLIVHRLFVTVGLKQLKLANFQIAKSNCEFSVNSTKEFKERFCAIKDKFNPLIYEVVSFDATALYTNIDIKRTVNFILDQIYRNVEDFFSCYRGHP